MLEKLIRKLRKISNFLIEPKFSVIIIIIIIIIILGWNFATWWPKKKPFTW
jgi:Tfp pilus assembly protein PilO